ncbi:MAG: TrmB family transcriptional regulator [Gemmatimonadales bacterium]
MSSLDLTGFGFTPTESLAYEVLVRGGPGTGYAIARAAGLARANAYSALEGLVQKGAARVEPGRPKRYRPEPPATLIARIVDTQAQALDTLSAVLDQISVPPSPTLVEIDSTRGALQLLSHEIARAEAKVRALVPGDGFPALTPALRKAAAGGVALELGTMGTIELPFATVATIAPVSDWPGEPLVAVIDQRGALIAARTGDAVSGHWGTDAVHIASAHRVLDSFRGAR